MISVVKDDGKSIVYAKSTDDRDDALAAVTDKNDVVIFREMDTGKDYVYNDGDWYEYTEEGGGGGGGGGGGSEPAKQINFIDYDGTILHSYTAAEFSSVTELPANPSHEGLVAQGWNWTKAEIDAQLTAMPGGDVWVGQMYITESGATEIDVTFDNPDYLSPYLVIYPNGTLSVDWGDGSATDTITGTSLSSGCYQQHVYPATGSYTIKISLESGEGFRFSGSSSVPGILRTEANNTTKRRHYASCITAIRGGGGLLAVHDSAFYYCSFLQSVTIPSGVSIGSNTFAYCSSLQSVTIPSGVTSINMFAYCSSLQSVAIPSGVTIIGSSAFNYCSALRGVTIPSDVTSIGNSAFNSCSVLRDVTIPSGVTSIVSSAFYSCSSLQSVTIPSGVTSIGSNAFYYCQSLQSVTIPSGVTSIGSSTFSQCTSVVKYHILPTTPPTLANTNAFTGIVSGTIIYVPTASLEAYQTAENWSTYASYMQGE